MVVLTEIVYLAYYIYNAKICHREEPYWAYTEKQLTLRMMLLQYDRQYNIGRPCEVKITSNNIFEPDTTD